MSQHNELLQLAKRKGDRGPYLLAIATTDTTVSIAVFHCAYMPKSLLQALEWKRLFRICRVEFLAREG